MDRDASPIRRALVLGANGQDGTYLVRNLVSRHIDVIATGKEACSGGADGIAYHEVDLRDRSATARLLADTQPDAVFHFAAVHKSAAGAPYETRFGDMLDVNVASVHVVLEHLRKTGGRLIYASSIKAFGEPLPEHIDEATPLRSSCLYGITKNGATELIHHYRKKHGVLGSIVWLGNHESPLRPPDFFMPKLARCIANADAAQPPETFFTLDFCCDWGSAEEYAGIVVDALLMAPGQDFVLGTGQTVLARDLARRAFAKRNLALERHITEAEPHREPATYQLDNARIQELVGRAPHRAADSVLDELVAHYCRLNQ